jgi:hypothetical protein
MDEDGNVMDVQDTQDMDGDAGTICVLEVPGYVLGVETYASQQALIPDKYYAKIVYESDGVKPGKSMIYMDAEEYGTFSNYSDGKNIMDVYYVGTVFPASVTVSETQFAFPLGSVDLVVIDAAGNPVGVADVPDRDGDPETTVRLTVNGYVLDIDGYESETDRQKRRFLNMMSYNHDTDTTDIYFGMEEYEHLASLGNGRNVVSVYSVGAGIGTDASRLAMADRRDRASRRMPRTRK